MAIYAKTTKELMHDFAKANLREGQVFGKDLAVAWFSQHYSRINPNTVRLHVEGMSINAETQRKHNPHIGPKNGWDLFFKLGRGQYRLWNPSTDPAPYYAGGRSPALRPETTPKKPDYVLPSGEVDDEEPEALDGGREFAFESDLRDYLARNLGVVEQGLVLFEDEQVKGIEYPVGGRYIDILGMDAQRNFVVIELKVSRGYDRTIGQLLRYMAWVERNLADGKKVRGIIVASNITEDLKLAASRIPDVILVEYEISFRLKPVT